MAFLALFISLFLQALPALQGEEYLVKNFTVEDGLPVNSVNRILQDDHGYLWFSTMDGLVRYDGYEFTIYNSANTKGLYSNRIAGMLITRSGELWLVHSDGALTRKKGLNFQTFREANGDFPGSARQIVETLNGTLWVATTKGAAQFSRETDSFLPREHSLLQAEILAITDAPDGSVIFAGENGLIQFRNNRSVQLLSEVEFPISPVEIFEIEIFSDNNLWVTGVGGAFIYSLSEQEITYRFSPGEDIQVWDVSPLSGSHIVLSTSLGFYGFDITSKNREKMQPEFMASVIRKDLVYRAFGNKPVLLTENKVFIDGHQLAEEIPSIQSAFMDREGSLWISTTYNGVYQIQESSITNITPDDIPGFENIYPVIQTADGSFWAGSFHNGVFRLSDNGVTNWNVQNSNLPGNFFRFLYEDSDSTIYAGISTEGLWRFSQNVNEWERIEEVDTITGGDVTFQAMHRDRQGRLLFGTTGRMLMREKDAYSPFTAANYEQGSALQNVRVIRETADGSLLLGTYGNGLTILKEGVAKPYTTQNSDLTSDFIRDIFVQSADTVWLANEDAGLTRLILDDSMNISGVSNITSDAGLQNSLHRIIPTEDGRFWISSNGGILNVSLDELNRYVDGKTSELNLFTFNEEDGMVNREANGGIHTAGVLSTDQKIWFPNQKGVTIIDVLKARTNQIFPNPQPVIEEIIFVDTTLVLGDSSDISIPKGVRNLRIKFSAPNFSNPKRMQFRYKLEGVNPDWETGNLGREAVLTNIAPGIHQFDLIVYRSGNSVQAARASISILIPYYFYETTWFYGMMGLVGLLLLFGGIKYRTRILEQRELNLQERVDQQTEALKEAAEQKSRFFSGITHELKTPLSLIVSPLEDILDNQQNVPDKTIRNRLGLMHRSGQQLKNLVDQILDVTKLNSDAIKLTHRPVNITELTRQIIGQFQSKLEQEEIELVFESDPIGELIYLDTNAWERIVINLLSNAIRFSSRGSTIYVKISSEKDRVSLSVKDEGIGIAKKGAKKVFEYLYQAEGAEAAEGTGIGLYLVKGLVEHMGGSIGLKSKKGEGAEFTVFLQKGFDHFEDTDTIIHEPDVLQDPPVYTESSSTKKSSNSNQKTKAEHILIVEDNFDFRSYLQSVLAEHYEVITAPEGSEALEILKQDKADLVISDVMMPGMNGLEFVGKLRKKADYQHLPVIFLSAKNHEIDVETGLSTGADIYLTKPIQSKLLLSQVAAVLRREKILRSGQINEIKTTESDLANQIREIVYRQLANPTLNISMLGDALYMSRTTLYKEWNQISDTSLNDFIKQIRLNEAKVLLTEQGFSVQEAATAVGYSDANYFSTSFKKEFGVSPSEV